MLERVSLGQVRFQTPGVTADSRGVLLGRNGVLLFAALDGLVSWLRLFSDEASLDELGNELRLVRVKNQTGARALLAHVPTPTSYAMDRAARIARLVGGTSYTGSTRHFVKYRDERSPQGYDVTELSVVKEGADFVLYGEAGPQLLSAEADIDLRGLLLRLSLRRRPRPGDDPHDLLYMTTPPGLLPGALRTLWRAHVRADVAAVSPGPSSLFAREGQTSRYFVLRLSDVPARVARGLSDVPGISLYTPVATGVGVALGHEHPIALASCQSLFDPTGLTLMSAHDRRVDVVPGPLEFSSAERLTRFELGQPMSEDHATPVVAESRLDLGMRLELAPSSSSPRRVVATFLSWDEAPRLKQLVYALPPAMLRGHRVAATARGILLQARDGVDLVPLGNLLSEVAPGLLVPLGMDLTPRVAPDVLAEILGHGAERITVVLAEGDPFFLRESDLVALERRALSRLPAVEADSAMPPPSPERTGPTLVNDPVGAFALWSYPDSDPGTP